MDILERVIEDGLASQLLNETELEDLRDALDDLDMESIREALRNGIEAELAGREQRRAATVDWLRARRHGRPPARRGG